MSTDLTALATKLRETRHGDWEHATATVRQFLKEITDEVLRGCDPSRIGYDQSRIKTAPRIAAKIRRKINEDPSLATPTSIEDIEELVNDLIGFKVLCKSTRDLHLFAEKLCTIVNDPQCNCELAEPIDDYVAQPKKSGYRAFHAVLAVPVGVARTRVVKVEVQVKTRLQDAWGELTHEDMYKPGEAMQPTNFHRSIAEVMADLLASVDKLADQLAEDIENQSGRIDDNIPANGADPGDDSNGTRVATVTRSTSRYALAVDDKGTAGIILARSVRHLALDNGLIEAGDYVDVNDYLQCDDSVEVRVEVEDDATIFHPTFLPRKSGESS